MVEGDINYYDVDVDVETKGAKRDKAKKGELLSSKANQAEANVDVVGLAAAATNKGQKADGEEAVLCDDVEGFR